MKGSDNLIMEQVFWETNGKNKEGNIPIQSDIMSDDMNDCNKYISKEYRLLIKCHSV